MGSSQVTTESSTVLLVIEHLRPIGLLAEWAKVFLFQLKSLYWETFRDFELTWLKAGEDGVYPTGGKAGPAQPPYQIVLRISKQCCVKPWEAQLGCHSGSGQDSLKPIPGLLPLRDGANVKSDLWKVHLSININIMNIRDAKYIHSWFLRKTKTKDSLLC